MTKEDYTKRLELIRKESEAGDFVLESNISDWENYGKTRTYFSITETRPNSRHFNKFDFGYYDNKEEKYVPGKCNLEKNYTLSGTRF